MDILIAGLTIFVLALFAGFEIITKVPPTLHTPLMSGANAISGITIVGALLAAGSERDALSSWLGLVAILFATVNVVGGFVVTHRMLSLFQRKSSRDS
ncbi:MAG: NAD(P) transhydrogenase subunit alpha [Nitrospira sp.]|nr:NAD(P) transhydrogenase subunit alpha [Nitrospira sp.]